jgi:hypothetical protein
MVKTGLRRVLEMFEIAHTADAVFPPTDLYREGWMLRILLSIQSEGKDCLPFSFKTRSKWFSEARIGSPFLPRSRSDSLAEKHTNLDGVVGHFQFQSGTKTGIELKSEATQFIVIEAKMFSPLSKGTTNIKYYDQATRIMACIAWVIDQSGKPVDDFESLGFYVFAPQVQIDTGKFDKLVNKTSMHEKVHRRISEYSRFKQKRSDLQRWFDDSFIPTLDRIALDCVSWESIVKKVEDPSITEFFNRCLEYNR